MRIICTYARSSRGAIELYTRVPDCDVRIIYIYIEDKLDGENHDSQSLFAESRRVNRIKRIHTMSILQFDRDTPKTVHILYKFYYYAASRKNDI